MCVFVKQQKQATKPLGRSHAIALIYPCPVSCEVVYIYVLACCCRVG